MADGGAKTGVAAALDAALEAGPETPFPLRPAEQLSLLDQEREGRPTVAELIEEHTPRGPGRPKGARNRSTEDLQRYILAKYQHPVEVLAQAYSRPTAVLAAELGCDQADAYRLQLNAASKVAEYVAQKMPQALDLKGESVLPIFLACGSNMQQVAEAGDALGLLIDATAEPCETVPDADCETVETQELSEVTE